MDILKVIDRRRHWWKIFVIIFTVSIAVVGYIGAKSYSGAPPLASFRTESGALLFEGTDITDGQQVFLRRGLMDYGSFLGDGGLRGPDYTAQALRLTAQWMNEYYLAREEGLEALGERERTLAESLVRTRVQVELKENRYDPATNTVTVNPAQEFAYARLLNYYAQMFGSGGELVGDEAFSPPNYITEPSDLRTLSSFFYWGGWLCAAERPGQPYSYTHNWPYDPMAGNTPHGGLVLWSVIGVLVVILTIGVLFYYYGKLNTLAIMEEQESQFPPLATSARIDEFRPTATQRATYKFFAVAAILFLVQVTAGLLTLGDFVGFFASIGLDGMLPVTISRTWHSQISILWIAVCWFAATIWVLPLICRPEPAGQLASIQTLFWLLVVVAAGVAVGVPLGISGALGAGATRWFGLQGWEFMTMGRAYHHVLFWSFILWLVIVTRGLMPALRQKQSWSLPNWMVYSIAGIILMFTASFVARPDTNFVIADFWRWCTVHMWVEAFFELFTTIIVAYFLYLMGFVSHLIAARVVYLGALLFLGSGLVGISHNFYWNAKSIETVALGGVLSSLQIAPLVLLTIGAWRFRNMPQSALSKLREKGGTEATFGLGMAFAFLVAVNFWNFFGAGVLGFSINLPIVSYYEHGTYLTVNHGHAALMGVYGNLGVCAMIFCARWNIDRTRWNEKLLRTVFVSLNLGLALMVVLDLFPVGLDQLIAAMSEGGYALARSQEYVQGSTFQLFTWLRGIGVSVFVLGGVVPLVWFMVTRWFHLKPAAVDVEPFVVPESVLAVEGSAMKDVLAGSESGLGQA
ncbi:MAG: cbb3-type cytochrome c oxidase subunit I [Planctomycetota bacterium]|jgi:nitric oxide reductase subunit B|nr:cbb3-type cytochrome c oxidase subunit I [Planctomycetota bacterium]